MKTTTKKNPLKNLANSEVSTKANAIRKELAEKHGVPVRFINFGDCIRVAKGKWTAKSVRNYAGVKLEEPANNFVKALACDPETPTAWTRDTADEIAAAVGVTPAQVRHTIYHLQKRGFLSDHFGFFHLTNRPFPQPYFVG